MEAAGAAAAGVGELDAFDAIVMAEERFHGEGYQEGYAEGTHTGVIEGRQYGIQQGVSVGLEIGSYLGFAMTWQKLLHKCPDEKHSTPPIRKWEATNSVEEKLQREEVEGLF